MSDKSKHFDCVGNMREIRDRISEEIAHMTYEELVRWFREYRYSDSGLQRLAKRAAQQADAAGGASRRR